MGGGGSWSRLLRALVSLPHEASLQDGEPPMNPSFFVRVIIQ
jgi:hypothetical protein